MLTRTPTSRTVLVLALTAGLLTACGDDDEPARSTSAVTPSPSVTESEPTPTPAPTPTPTPTPTVAASDSAPVTPSAAASPPRSPRASASASPAPRGGAPVEPAAAAEASQEGAAAFARHYFDVIDHAYATGETELLTVLGTAECVPCRFLADTVSQLYSSGGRSTGGTATVTDVAVAGDPSAGSASVTVTYDATAYQEIAPGGEVEYSLDAQQGQRSLLELVREGDGWRVADFVDLSQPS